MLQERLRHTPVGNHGASHTVWTCRARHYPSIPPLHLFPPTDAPLKEYMEAAPHIRRLEMTVRRAMLRTLRPAGALQGCSPCSAAHTWQQCTCRVWLQIKAAPVLSHA